MGNAGLFRRHVALPNDHGSWVFFLGPLIIGLFAGGRPNVVSVYLTVAAACGFLIRQPVTLRVKIHAGRRPRAGLPAARFWIAVYAAIGALHVTGMVLRGFGFLLTLAIPGLAVFAWYLVMVYRRAERRQWLLELLATGVLALAAPAAMWVGLGRPDPLGWLLWVMVWIQSATGILYAYLRLAQRPLKTAPAPAFAENLRMGAPSIAMATIGLLAAIALGATDLLPRGLFVAYAVQWLEVLWGVRHPAIGWKPTAIGIRQLGFSIAFTVLFIAAWLA